MPFLECVNKNFRGQLYLPIDSTLLSQFTPPVAGKRGPPMWILKRPQQLTLLIFSSGKFRLMGRHASRRALYEIFPSSHVQYLHRQGATYRGKLPHAIHVGRLCDILRRRQHQKLYSGVVFEPELFSALSIHLTNGGGLINMFSTGSVMVLGGESSSFYTTRLASILTDINMFHSHTSHNHVFS